MWSDTLLAAERSHLIRVVLWAVTCAVLGSAVVSTLTLRRVAAPIILAFAIQTLAWGSAEHCRGRTLAVALDARRISGHPS